MLQKWKLILTNWINCYFKESNKKDLTVNLETLLDIISHLRENLNTSFSNSSLLDTHTVQEFIVEKYPDFKFENGSVEPDSEEDIYLAASLLLFFVCLNSKNVDLKNAMCSKLSPGDQETILKFSKHLMECSKITHSDIEAAITEACGQDIATPEPAKLHVMVAETPPAIRSYHSEVRRLQAALDAERFDRTYLQEELTRTNLKVEKLLQDKEQYKLEIVNLKAQISQCCGQDKEAQGDDIGANNTTKLVKQLEDMELRLVNTQEQLDDVQYERDNYKSKLTQLKSEHDNLLALSQQQSSRMNTLAEELETERRQTQTLRDLVAELRQHNSLNRMDSSFLECDDPDASIHSLHHNSSACSEVCANVIEVQLGEERAKIVSLKQQIQLLQDQLNEMSRKTEEEKQTLRQIVSEKERNIMDLKHRINEEIEEKNTLKAIFNDDVAVLNNERNELEQRLKGCQENSRQIIDKKILEIQNLKEQKISLLHSLSGKTTKLESIIRDLQYEIDAEKSSKIKLREEYDSHIMKLNEKVLNRNNELVELQNKIVHKGEEIEQLQLEIRKEGELRDQQLNKHNNDIIQLNRIREQTEQELQKKTDEVLKLHSDLQQHICIIEQMNKESNYQITDLFKQNNDLELEKNEYLSKINEMKIQFEARAQKENNERTQLKHDYQNLLEIFEKKKSEILNLETIMTNEKQQCKQLLDDVRKENLNLIDKCEILQESQTTAEIELKERQEKIENLNAEIKQLQELSEKNLKQRDEQIALLQKEKEEFRKHGEELKEEKEKLKKEIEYKVAVECELRQKLEDVMKSETESINLLAKENDLLKKTLAVKESYVASLEKQSNELKIKVDETETKLKNELEKSEKELYNKSEQHNNIALRLQERIQICNQTQAEVQALTRQVADLDKQKHTLELEKNELLKKFEEMKINHETHVQSINNELTQLKHDNQYLLNDLETKKIEITKLESLLNNEIQQNKQLQDDNNNQIQLLANRCDSLQEYRVKTEKELENKEKEIVTLNTEIKQLQEKNEKILQEKAEHINQMKQEKDEITNKFNKELNDQREKYLKETESKMAAVCELRTKLDVMRSETDSLDLLTKENELLKKTLSVKESYVATLEKQSNELKIQKDAVETELKNKLEKMEQEMHDNLEHNNKTEALLQEKNQICNETQTTLQALNDQISDLQKQKNELVLEKNEYLTKLEEMKAKLEENTQKENELSQLKQDHQHLLEVLESKKSEIINLESLLMYEKQQNKLLQDDNSDEKRNLTNKCSILQEYQSKAELELERRQKEIETLSTEMKQLQQTTEKNMREQDELLTRVRKQNYELINKLSKELLEEREKCLRETELKSAAVYELRQKLQDVMNSETDSVKLLRKENELLKRTLAIKESFAVAGQEKSSSKSASQDADAREHHQVDNTSTDHSHSSLESYKTISDLEKILQDRNRTITSLQSDITYMKSLLAESEINLLDVTKDLEVCKENCHQLSNQLKKIVHQKNEEIADLKKQVAKMSVNENRASQIIKVSAKYQAIILKRIAEIKSNTVLKELTNFGNTANCDTDLRRSLNAGTVTMEDLENFLDTTDRHLRRCSEKQLALQKERDRLAEVNKINESEIINMKKFLTELSVSIKTFNSVKELYTQKLSRVISLQRTVKREILSLDGRITDATMCRLQRDYASVMQDLTECAMNLERWVERCLGRAISAEKIKQAFSTEERPSLAPTFQNASLEVQLEELENYFCKLLEEVSRAQKGDGAKDAQAVTVMEVRAEYEDKLNRMKAKMKQLYQEQIGIFKEKQREEIVALEEELQKARDKLAESSRAYEEHIKALTTELWNVGEKFLMKKNEAEWLRRKQRHGSLMSLQHVHSSGLVPPQEEPSRPSDTHSLRSLPVATNSNSNNNKKNEGRGLHMSDEEGEVFDNRCLRELATTPGRDPRRLSELQWRNSLCPPHLKSSYPVETQFVPAVHEEDIKCVGAPSMAQGGRTQRKEVGITAYKKPGPPTPSKQAGRLSATDSELRESLRVEMEPNASRKTSTPSRIRALFRSSKAETLEGTPRSRRLSNIFRKK